MAFCAAAEHVLVPERSVDRLPVIDQIGAYLLHNRIIITGVLYPRQHLLGCQQVVLVDVFIKSLLDPLLIVQHEPGYPIDIFHQVEPIRNKNALVNVIHARFDPARPISTDIHLL